MVDTQDRYLEAMIGAAAAETDNFPATEWPGALY